MARAGKIIDERGWLPGIGAWLHAARASVVRQGLTPGVRHLF
jgi:hypothetical protein